MHKLMLVFVIGLFISFTYGIVPPRYGKFSEEFQLLIPEIQKSYTQGNLPKLLKDWHHAKEQAKLNQLSEGFFPDTLTMNIPVLMGRFADDPNYIVDAPTQMQQQLFDGPWPTLTMREFYQENSYGQFDLTGTVYGWISVAHPESLYAPDDAALFVIELLDSVDSYVNFADYDNDGDGYVEGVIVVHSTIGAEYGHSSHIWSHRWSLSGAGYGVYLTNDLNTHGIQVKVNDYSIQGSKTYGGGLERIGVFCHEFGHLLGLPDLYDTDYSSEGIGDWGLMSGGSWNEPESPSHFSAWCKEALGWLDPVMVEEDMEYVEILPVENDPVVYKLWYEGSVSPYTSPFGAGLDLGRQYFLIENRQKIGSDVHLHENGLLIWHIDNTITNNRDENHKLVDLEEADGLNHLDNNENSGDAGDPFPGSSINQYFNFFTNPNSQAYNSSDSKVSISDILPDNQKIYADLEVGLIKYEFLSLNYADNNGDGIYEPGEEIQFWMELRNNTASTANNMVWNLTSLSNDISITGNPVSLGNVAAGDSVDNAASPIILNINSSSSSYTAKLELRIEVDGLTDKITVLPLVIGVPDLLVLDQDINRLCMANFMQFLDSEAYSYELIQPAESSSDKWRINHRNFIALVGGDNALALSDTLLQDSLMAWMNMNKNLLVISSTAASTLDSATFARDFLHVQYEDSTTNIILKGEAGDPLGYGGGFVFLENSDYEMISPVNGSIASLKFNGTLNGGLVRHEDTSNNKIVYLSFDPRQIKSNSPIAPEQVFSDILDWFGITTSVEPEVPGQLLSHYVLMQNYPNPFNPQTTIRFYNIHSNENVSLVIFNSLGQKVKQFESNNLVVGWNEVTWDGTNHSGTAVASGVYYFMLKARSTRLLRKMVLLR